MPPKVVSDLKKSGWFSAEDWTEIDKPLPNASFEALTSLVGYVQLRATAAPAVPADDSEDVIAADVVEKVKAIEQRTAALRARDKRILGPLYVELRNKVATLLADDRTKAKSSKAKTQSQTALVEKAASPSGKSPSTKAAKPKRSKVDEMKYQNTLSKLSQSFVDILGKFNPRELNFGDAMQSDVLEHVCLSFIYIMKYATTHSMRQEDRLEVFIAAQKFIAACEVYVGKNILDSTQNAQLDPQMIADLREAYARLSEEHAFDGSLVYRKYPKLLLATQFDQYIPGASISPHDHQKQLIDECLSNTTGFCIRYCVMTGAGKTSTVVALAKIVEHLRRTTQSKMRLIVACEIHLVRKQIAQMLLNLNLPFSIAMLARVHEDSLDTKSQITQKMWFSHSYSTHRKRVRNPITKKWEDKVADPFVFVTDSRTAGYMLESAPELQDHTMLFLDEANYGADQADDADLNSNNSLCNNVMTMMNAPKYSIFVGATFPKTEELVHITQRIRTTYPQCAFKTIGSNRIQIGCDVFRYDGSRVLPWNDCETGADLTRVLDTIEAAPFFGKMLTCDVAAALHECCSANGVEITDLKKLFSDVKNMTIDAIRRITMDMLRTVAKHPDELVRKICSLDVDKEMVTQVSQVTQMTRKLNIADIGTSLAHKLPGMTLIAVVDPQEFALRTFEPLLQYTRERVKSMRTMLDDYKNKLSAYESDTEKMLANTLGDDKDTLEHERGETRPKLSFPIDCSIGSTQHTKVFAASATTTTPRSRISLEQINFAAMDDVPDDLLLLLACGVGVYIETGCVGYVTEVLRLANEGALAFLIAENLSYGVNLPIDRVIITEQFSKSHSVGTCLQVQGRAGRPGRSYKAESFVDDNTAKNFIDYLLDPDSFRTEIDNINRRSQSLAVARAEPRLRLGSIDSL